MKIRFLTIIALCTLFVANVFSQDIDLTINATSPEFEAIQISAVLWNADQEDEVSLLIVDVFIENVPPAIYMETTEREARSDRFQTLVKKFELPYIFPLEGGKVQYSNSKGSLSSWDVETHTLYFEIDGEIKTLDYQVINMVDNLK